MRTGCARGFALALVALACSRRGGGDAATAAPPAAAAKQASARPEPHGKAAELLTYGASAYAAGLVAEPDAIFLLTDRIAFRVAPGGSPQRIAIENGGTAAVTRTDLIYWSKGAIWSVPKTGGQPRRLAALEQQPQSFMASGADFSWLATPVHDQFAIQVLDGQQVRTLYYHPGRIEAAAMDAGRVFFVGRGAGTSWRIGSVSIHGGEVAFAAPKSGPTPAKLAAAGEVFYYDLDSGELRRLSADLSREEVLSKSLICSPLAVAAKICCANVQGLYWLPRQPGAAAAQLFPEPRTIAAVGVTATFAAWIADAGADRLSLMTMPLP